MKTAKHFRALSSLTRERRSYNLATASYIKYIDSKVSSEAEVYGGTYIVVPISRQWVQNILSKSYNINYASREDLELQLSSLRSYYTSLGFMLTVIDIHKESDVKLRVAWEGDNL